MLNKRQYNNLKRIVSMCDENGYIDSSKFFNVFDKEKGNFVVAELGEMGLVASFFEGMKISPNGYASLDDYRNTKLDKWESRIFHFFLALPSVSL